MHRNGFEVSWFEEEHVSTFSDFDAAEFIFHSDGFGTTVRTHCDGFRRGDSRRVSSEAFLDECREFQTLQVVRGIVARRAIGSDRYRDFRVKAFADRCRTGAQIHVGNGVIAY